MLSRALPLTAGMILSVTPVFAGGLKVEVTLPQIAASPYYRPYLAAWIEDADKQVKGTVAIWYDTRLRDNIGLTFLRELRNWWRLTGQAADLPIDGVSGPTRPPGQHDIVLAADHPMLSGLPAGEYVVAVEVTREDGGRETLRAPFTWGAGENRSSASGQTELGGISVIADEQTP